MTTAELLGGLSVVVAAGLYYFTVRSARRHAWSARVLAVLSAISGIGLILMVLTDWPSEQLSSFWADHSILAAVVSSLLLISVGYLAFEAGESFEQAELSRSVSSAGLSGLVDHLVDIDIALWTLTNDHPPAELSIDGKPLRWIRPVRERLQAGADPATVIQARTDPASHDPFDWRSTVVDQCIRRIIAGMRDWAALISTSDDGRLVLKRLGQLRLTLLELQKELRCGNAAAVHEQIRRLRLRVQLLAFGLDVVSSPGMTRPGLTNFMPGPLTADEAKANTDALETAAPRTAVALFRLLDSRPGQ